MTSELSKFSCEPKEDYYRFALDYAGGSFDDNSWVKDCTDVSRKTLHVPEVAEDDKDLEY